jgi:hypothetical protein
MRKISDNSLEHLTVPWHKAAVRGYSEKLESRAVIRSEAERKLFSS